MIDTAVVSTGKAELEDFLTGWTENRLEVKARVESFFTHLAAMKGVEIDFVARPGVSYSLRPKRPQQAAKGRALFAMIDIIDDEPEARWLSVCFYGDMISDPQEYGELIPGGLAGDDGYCFDLFEDDADKAAYITSRLDEAAEAARS